MKFKPLLRGIGASLLVIGALSVSAFANADDVYSQPMYGQQQVQPYQIYNDQSCCQQNCYRSYMLNCNTQTCCEPPVCGWAYNPPAYCKCVDPCGNTCSKYGLTFDFLWWKASVGGIALGTEEEISFLSNGSIVGAFINNENTYNNSHQKRPDFKFEPGFRLGIADYSICECWDAALAWTHYHSTAHAHGASNFDTNGPITAFFSYWERVPRALFPTESKARYSLNLDLLDLEFGRKYFVSSCFVLRPHLGLRGARINQDYKVISQRLGFNNKNGPASYVNPNLNNIFLDTGPDFTNATKSRNNFLAIGPRLGLDIEVKLGCGLSIVGQAAGSLVYGRFNRHSKEELTEGPTLLQASGEDFELDSTSSLDGREFSYNTSSSNFMSTRAFSDLAIGLKWERCLDWCNTVHPVGLEFTWEHHGYFNMSGFDFDASGRSIGGIVNPSIPDKDGDIFTQGLTVSAFIGF